MREKDWLVSNDPAEMLLFMQQRTSRRKLRLFGCGCCRLIWHLLIDDEVRQAAEVAERFADGLATEEELGLAQAKMHAATEVHGQDERDYNGVPLDAVKTVSNALWGGGWHSVKNAARSAWEARRAQQSTIVRDIFGNPFRPVTIDSSLLTWHDATIPKLAQAAYDERELPSGHLDTKRLAILADALEEAGCTNEDVLAHLRGAGPHVRGCWVVDLLLGKE